MVQHTPSARSLKLKCLLRSKLLQELHKSYPLIILMIQNFIKNNEDMEVNDIRVYCITWYKILSVKLHRAQAITVHDKSTQ